MSSKLILTSIFSFLLISALKADEIKCIGYSGFNPTNSIVELAGDCELQKNLAQDKLIQDEHRKNIYEKLSEKLALQIKQNSEDISLLTTFYNANGQDLMMNSKDVANSCRLDSVKSIENCGGKKNGPYQEMKLAMLKSKLPKFKNTPFQNDSSLYGLMAGKFYSDLGMKQGNDLQCPIQGQSGSFLIKSQIDDLSAEDIVHQLVTIDQNDFVFDNYAQLKIIKNSKDPSFIKKFREYIKAKPDNKNSKEYISSFFFDPENQQKLAPTLASQCERMNKNLNKFLCSDLSEMGSLDNNTSQILFNKLNTTDSMEDQYEVDFNDPSILTAYGMQCLAKENNSKNPDREKVASFQSIDQWYADFTNNTRPEDSIESNNNITTNFCSAYTCQAPEAKLQISCKKGGPLSSKELGIYLGCYSNPRKAQCTSDMLKSIAYMQNLEKLKNDSKDQVAVDTSSPSSSSSPTRQEKIVSGRLPNFAENYFGVEGSLKALGKPVTAYEISEKKQDFAEKKLATNEPVYNSPAAVKIQKTKEQPTVATADSSSVRPTYTPTQMTQSTPTVVKNGSPAPSIELAVASKTSSTKKTSKVVDADTMESSRLREEMEKMIADIKTTKKEIADTQEGLGYSQSSLGSSSLGAANNTGTSYTNRAEQERLKRLEQSLNDKANRLEEYRRELDNRNFAQLGPQGEGNSRSVASSGGGGGSGGQSNSSGSSAGGGSSNSSVKLTAGNNAKIDGKANNTAALIQSGVESSVISADEISNLSPDRLKKLGIDATRPFTLKVTFESKTYQVPVRNFKYKDSMILGPIMDPKEKALNAFLLKSPLFKDYMEYMYNKAP